MKDLLERLMKVSEGWKTNDWFSWWIVDGKLIEVGHEMSAGDHYATLYVIEDPSPFGLDAKDLAQLKKFREDEDGVFSDPDEWGDIVFKVMRKAIRAGVNRGTLYLDLPAEDDKWLHMVQDHRQEISKANPQKVLINIFTEFGNHDEITYVSVPIDEFWSAEKLSDLRAYKDV